MKEYLMNQYKHYLEVALYFCKLTGRANKDMEIQYSGMRQAIGDVLIDCGYMTRKELTEYHSSLLGI